MTDKPSKKRWLWFHRLSSTEYFYGLAGRWAPWLGWLAFGLLLYGLFGGLVLAPNDYQMGNSFRIMYVHVPSAWMSLFIYMVIAVSGCITLIWRIKLADCVSRAAAPLGAMFTAFALITGSLWGKPTWGTYWEWDARMTSELILLFLYLGYIALTISFDDRRTGSRAGAILAIVGVINIPIIHFSVEWWQTLHQGASVTKIGAPSIQGSMLTPLLIMFLAFKLYFFAALMRGVRVEILQQDQHHNWVKQLATTSK